MSDLTAALEQPEGMTPFSCGSDYLGWRHRNCGSCQRLGTIDPATGDSGCDLETALSLALVGDGLITTEAATRIGVPGDCRERAPW